MPDEKILKIGRFELVLPTDHMLETYKRKFKLYDWILGEVARLVTAKYPDATAIDIGANVGDSAAVLSRHGDMPILCIEGHPTFITFLRDHSELPIPPYFARTVRRRSTARPRRSAEIQGFSQGV